MLENREKIVGILGGMGPEATIDLMQRIVRLTPAGDDEDHIHCIIDNNTKVPSRIKAIIEKRGENPGTAIALMAKKLESLSVDLLAMPCNTAHYYYPEIQSAVNIPVLNIIDLTVRAALAANADRRGCRIGLLGSPGIQLTGIYDDKAQELGSTILYPDPEKQSALLTLIKKVKAGARNSAMCEELYATIESLAADGADVAVIACTELSVINTNLKASIPLIDAAEVLAQTIVNEVKGVERKPY